jgi:transposase InsO family protein
MSERESRYSQPKLELFGLYRALRAWRLYIIGVKTLHVEVDAKFIAGLLNNPDLQPDMAVNRWIQGILMFHFVLHHVPATKFQGPDALSRRGKAEDEIAVSDDDDWLDQIALAYLKPVRYFANLHQSYERMEFYPPDQLPPCHMTRTAQETLLDQVRHFLKTLEMPNFSNTQKQRRFIAKATEFYEHGGRLWKRNGDKGPLIVVCEPMAHQSILTQAHENLGHRKTKAMWESLHMRFYWPHLRADIHHHVASCHQCQIRSTHKVEIPPTVSTPVTIFSKIYIDIMRMPKAGGYNMIVAARDDLSGFCEAKALASQTAENLAEFFWVYLYCRYGCPLQVTTDNGSEVKAAFEILMKRLGIPQVTISPYNKHANGVVERGHFTLREAIVKACDGVITRWPKKLAAALFADRVTISSVTGYSPFQLLHATDPILPFNLTEATFLVEGFYSGMTTSELLALRIRQLQKHPRDIAHAAEILRKSRFASKQQFEKRFKRRLQQTDHHPGDLVLLRNMKHEGTVSLDLKVTDRYLGPYEVHRKNRGGAYELKELDGTHFKQAPVAAFRLLPYITRNHWFMRTGWMGNDSPEEEDSSSAISEYSEGE